MFLYYGDKTVQNMLYYVFALLHGFSIKYFTYFAYIIYYKKEYEFSYLT